MVSELDRKIVNFLDEFEQEQQAVQQRVEEFAGDENALRRRSEDPDSFDECKRNSFIKFYIYANLSRSLYLYLSLHSTT